MLLYQLSYVEGEDICLGLFNSSEDAQDAMIDFIEESYGLYEDIGSRFFLELVAEFESRKAVVIIKNIQYTFRLHEHTAGSWCVSIRDHNGVDHHYSPLCDSFVYPEQDDSDDSDDERKCEHHVL